MASEIADIFSHSAFSSGRASGSFLTVLVFLGDLVAVTRALGLASVPLPAKLDLAGGNGRVVSGLLTTLWGPTALTPGLLWGRAKSVRFLCAVFAGVRDAVAVLFNVAAGVLSGGGVRCFSAEFDFAPDGRAEFDLAPGRPCLAGGFFADVAARVCTLDNCFTAGLVCFALFTCETVTREAAKTRRTAAKDLIKLLNERLTVYADDITKLPFDWSATILGI